MWGDLERKQSEIKNVCFNLEMNKAAYSYTEFVQSTSSILPVELYLHRKAKESSHNEWARTEARLKLNWSCFMLLKYHANFMRKCSPLKWKDIHYPKNKYTISGKLNDSESAKKLIKTLNYVRLCLAPNLQIWFWSVFLQNFDSSKTNTSQDNLQALKQNWI